MHKPPKPKDMPQEVYDFLHPDPLSIDQALLAKNPVSEISRRLMNVRSDDLSPTELLFRSADYFRSDTLNGGLHQTMTNSTGEVTHLTAAFCAEYCCPELALLFRELVALFPNGMVPADRDLRCDLVDQMGPCDETHPLEALTERFYKLEPEFVKGLIALATRHKDDFPDLR